MNRTILIDSEGHPQPVAAACVYADNVLEKKRDRCSAVDMLAFGLRMFFKRLYCG